jgi:hypothetical protein
MPSVTSSRREWIIFLPLAVLLAALFVLPYLLGHAQTKPDTVYTGLLINVDDGTYLSAIEQGRQGHWTYRNLFTSEPHQPAFIQGYYLALGQLARLLGLSSVTIWHVGLFLADLVFFILLFYFVAFFFPNRLQRGVAFTLIVFGGGFDWQRFPTHIEWPNSLEAVPVDLHMPEAHPFFSALTYPHFVAGITLIMLTLWLALYALTAAPGDSRRWWFAAAAGVSNLLLAVVYPFLLLLIAAVLAVYYLFLCWRSRRFLWPAAGVGVVTFAVPLPLLLYYASVLAANPIMQRWNDQAVTLSPHPLHYILAYLPYLLPALLTLRLFKKATAPRQEAFTFLWTWVVVAIVLLYTPVNPQRRFVEGLQIPLAILTTIGLFEWVLPWLGNTRLFRSLAHYPRYSVAGLQKLVVALFIAFASLISLFIYTATLLSLTGEQPYPLFRPLAEAEAMSWLKTNTAEDDVILSAYWTGSWLPSQTGRPVVIGHFYETAYFAEKLIQSERFFAATTPHEWRRELMARYQVSYLFWGQAEQELGEFDPASADYLQPVFANDQVHLYRVQPSPVE